MKVATNTTKRCTRSNSKTKATTVAKTKKTRAKTLARSKRSRNVAASTAVAVRCRQPKRRGGNQQTKRTAATKEKKTAATARSTKNGKSATTSKTNVKKEMVAVAENMHSSCSNNDGDDDNNSCVEESVADLAKTTSKRDGRKVWGVKGDDVGDEDAIDATDASVYSSSEDVAAPVNKTRIGAKKATKKRANKKRKKTMDVASSNSSNDGDDEDDSYMDSDADKKTALKRKATLSLRDRNSARNNKNPRRAAAASLPSLREDCASSVGGDDWRTLGAIDY